MICKRKNHCPSEFSMCCKDCSFGQMGFCQEACELTGITEMSCAYSTGQSQRQIEKEKRIFTAIITIMAIIVIIFGIVMYKEYQDFKKEADVRSAKITKELTAPPDQLPASKMDTNKVIYSIAELEVADNDR